MSAWGANQFLLIIMLLISFLLPENDLFEAIYEFIGIEKEYDTKDIN